MTRVVGPESNSRFVYRSLGTAIVSAAGASAVVYAAESGGTLASILTEAGAAISGSVVTVNAYSQLPLFQFPDGVSTVFVEVAGGPRTAVYSSAVFGAPAPANGPDFIISGITSVPVPAQDGVFLEWFPVPTGDDGSGPGNPPAWFQSDSSDAAFLERGIYSVTLSIVADSQDISLVGRTYSGVDNFYFPIALGPVPDPFGFGVGPFGATVSFNFAALDVVEGAFLRLVANNAHATDAKNVRADVVIHRIIAFG